MTGDMMQLRALVKKNPDADLLREMIGFMALPTCAAHESTTLKICSRFRS